jgi:hypothetical protein
MNSFPFSHHATMRLPKGYLFHRVLSSRSPLLLHMDPIYTKHWQLFHMLHESTPHAQYSQFLDDPALVPVSWLAILFILLSLTVTALEETDPVLRDLARGQDPCNNIRLLSRRYREAAMKCLAKQGVFWRAQRPIVASSHYASLCNGS